MSDSVSEKWRAPVAVQVKAVVGATIGVVVAVVFFPVWLGIPVAAVLAAWGLGMGVRRPAVALYPGSTGDPGAGAVAVTMGFLTRKIALADLAVVQIEGTKVTFGKTDGTAVSLHAWRRGRLDRWLRVPDIASDMAHAISKAASAVRPADAVASAERAGKPKSGAGATIRSGKNLPLLVMAVAGLIEIAAVFFVRVSWPGPVMTALGALVAVGFGFAGVFTVIFALWHYLAGRPAGTRARG